MKNTVAEDYAKLDRPEILSVLFYPRKEDDSFDRRKGGFEMLIPVAEHVSVGACLYRASKNAPTILFFHGNGEIVADYEDIGPLYARCGINFLAVDYRGYGRSKGYPTVTAMMADCHAILACLTEWFRREHYTGPLIVMGRSLGSASALELAYRHSDTLAGLVIESGFAYMMPLLRLMGIPFASLGISEEDGCRNIEKIKAVTIPTLIIHSQYDQIIPFSDGKTLYNASGTDDKRLLMIPGADHNTIFAQGLREYMAAIEDFTKSLTPAQS